MPESGDTVLDSALHRIVAACDRYETALRDGVAPRIEAFLEEFDPAWCEPLFHELLAIDVNLRMERGEQPAIEEYVDRFPDRAESVRQKFQTTWPGRAEARPGDGQTTDATSPPGPGAAGNNGLSQTRDTPSDRTLPARLGRYIPTSILGVGGCGTVYLARDDELNRQVAIKVPHTRAIGSRDKLEALLREARLAAGLRHPAIVRVLDISLQGDDAFFLVLEYISGRTLEEVLRADRPAPGRLAEIVVRVCEAVHHAHKAGLVHRDLKPENILINGRGEPFVSDFGLAIHEDLQHRQGAEIAGTPRFMAPEQVRGETHRLDGRTDIWAIGVILYLGLCGRHPFLSPSRDEIFDEILNRDPKPPRQVSDDVPRELERVCLKCLAKRMADRYQTAADLAEDLCLWLAAEATGASAGPATASRATGPGDRVRVVPKGLRSFDTEDADFFLSLLPGPRDRDGLPESIRSWKARLETRDPARAFPVCLLYGPSGCGKSSLVKAGLLPRLVNVEPIYVEASPEGIDARLLPALRKRFPSLPASAGLAEAAALLREGSVGPKHPKVLIVLDQFEQWLHHHFDDSGSELVQALRQCDGLGLQALILVRDDFWMGVTRFLRAVEVPLVEGENSSGVELFDAAHARRVLVEVGRAHGRLPDEPAPIPSEANQFLDRAIAELAGPGGRIIPVRLSLFAEMVKHRPWSPATLRELGGIEGIRVTFLEETFAAPSAPPAHRLHRRAVLAVLQALLPEPSSDLKGKLQPGRMLQQTAGYTGRDREFAELMGILDHELRLVTPVDVDDSPGAALEPAQTPHERHYQLAHDYLVPSLRQWLTRKQRETRRGRAELCLDLRTSLWTNKPESKQLPSWPEWLGIRLLIPPASWTPPQRRLMRAASRHHLARSAVFMGAFALVTAGLFYANRRWHEGSVTLEIQRLSTIDLRYLPALLDRLAPDVYVWKPQVEQIVRSPSSTEEARTRAALALARHSSEHIELLTDRMLEASAAEHLFLRGELSRWRVRLLPRLWRVLDDEAELAGRRLAAASALAAFDPAGPKWHEAAAPVAHELLNLDPLLANDWVQALRPVQFHLRQPLLESFALRPGTDVRQLLAGSILAKYGDDNPEFMPDELLAELVLTASPKQYAALVPLIRKHPGLAGPMTGTLAEEVPLTSHPEDERQIDRQANAAETLLVLDRPEAFWPRLGQSPDPRLRTRLIDRLAAPRLTAEGLWDRVNREKDGAIRQAILIGLGSGFSMLSPQERIHFAPGLLVLFESDPDPGVHGAAEWVLATWGFPTEIVAAKGRMAGKPRAGRRWFISSELHTMIVVPAPGRFMAGSPNHEPSRDINEGQHEVTIDYPFAVSAFEITDEQYRHFRDMPLRDPAITPGKECPIAFVAWSDAASYCHWLTDLEGIEAGEQCYPALVPDRTTMVLPDAFLRRHGFRLPTEHEWEYVARAGSSTSRFFGNAESDLDKYAWFARTSGPEGGHTWPVGLLRPNPLGLFDIYGNVHEHCEIWPPTTTPELGPFRGGGYRSTGKFLRSAMPDRESRLIRPYSNFGFRIAMTLEAP